MLHLVDLFAGLKTDFLSVASFMTKVDANEDRASRIGRIQAIVQEDFDRIKSAANPYAVLNLEIGATEAEIRDRYERYERFYRAENFQRLGDMDLTRKALDVRRAIGRAIVEIRAAETPPAFPTTDEAPETVPQLPSVDPDSAALGDIYFRDGLTYLRLGDFNSAKEHLERACGYDPSRGIILANLAYTRFKIDPTSPQICKDVRRSLLRAGKMEPDNVEICVILARFGINTRDLPTAHEAIRRVEKLRPDHPRLNKLKARAKF
jgi:tetratricopeptide (TPR) repeat protein